MFLCMRVPFPTSPTMPVLGPPHFYFNFKGRREALTFPFGTSLSLCKKKKTVRSFFFFLRLNKDACKIHDGRFCPSRDFTKESYRRWKCVITFPTDGIVAVGRTKDGWQRQRNGNSGGRVGWRDGASAALPGILRNSSWLQPSAARLSALASSFYSPACLKDKTGASDKRRLIRNSARFFLFQMTIAVLRCPNCMCEDLLQITCNIRSLEADSLGAKQTSWQSMQVYVSV